MMTKDVSLIKRFFKKKVLFLCCIIFFSRDAFAGTFTLQTNNSNLSFGSMRNGEWKETGGSDYQVTCQSSGGSTWYLKIQLLSPLSSWAHSIEAKNFKWMAAWTDGSGIPSNQYQYNDFTTIPMLVYTSGSADNSGNAIILQLKYGVYVPPNQIAGNYSGIVRYIMTETL